LAGGIREWGGGKVESARMERPLHLLTLSAMTEEALMALAGRYVKYLGEAGDVQLADVCYSANVAQNHFGHRLAVVGNSIEVMRSQVADMVAGKKAGVSGQIGGNDRPRVAYLFTGQGSQYVGMAQELYQTQPTFRKVLEHCDTLLRPYLERPLLSVLYPAPGESSPLDETAYTQPALFALEYGLAELWKSWGIDPSVVMGHSVGEYAAACVAGLFNLEDGLKLIATRGRLMQGLPAGGQMVAVFCDEGRVRQTIASYTKTISVASINGPGNVVISGSGEQVQEIVKGLEAQKIKMQRLTVSHAFHSPLMEPILDEFEQVAGELTYQKPGIGLVSNVTGEMWGIRSDPSDQESAIRDRQSSYWRAHVREAVQFEKGMQTLAQQNCQVYLEMGPNPVLLGMGKRCLKDPKGEWLASLRKGTGDWQQMLDSLARLYVNGVTIDWTGFDRDYPRHKVALPT
jgi:acyl transferase domain-containing protein